MRWSLSCECIVLVFWNFDAVWSGRWAQALRMSVYFCMERLENMLHNYWSAPCHYLSNQNMNLQNCQNFKFSYNTFNKIRQRYQNFNLYEPCLLYIGRAYRYFQTPHFIYFFNKYKYWMFFSPAKCHLIDNAAFFVSCIIHILHTGCAKI